ncbi:hypothetical protein O3M35_010789 [Rhynocoris fuscipes]|uniref:Uncharacterized protein n=1 Tax=Rhynocoris fuscipes TaxID=488301 RepID=A0AAW1D809_9HEMI
MNKIVLFEVFKINVHHSWSSFGPRNTLKPENSTPLSSASVITIITLQITSPLKGIDINPICRCNTESIADSNHLILDFNRYADGRDELWRAIRPAVLY